MFMLRIVYRVLAVLLFIGIFVGIWHELKPFPEMAPIKETILEYPIVICSYIVNYADANWLPLAIGMVFWCAVTLKMMLGRTKDSTSSVLRAVVALLNYFEIEIETDAMKEHRAVGTWKLMKIGFKQGLIFWLLGIPQPVDEYTGRAVRRAAPASFDGDIDRKLRNLKV
jgi:hypothetical protein